MSTTNEFRVKGEELLQKIKQIIHEGNVSRIIIKDENGRTYLEIPVTVGVVGAIFAPVLAAVGALAALAANFTIEVIKKE
jgi:phage-related minor tail protein